MHTLETFKVKLAQLVELFDRNREAYKSKEFLETQVRHQFIDPLFIALGWDVNNEHGYAEQYKDVIHEDRVRIEGKQKAPDYSFRIGGVRKFFVEAKQPSVKIETDLASSFQLRRYAWSAKLPVSILTDFEELSIYDCTVEPKARDKAETARIAMYGYRDFLKHAEALWNIFSKEAVLKGSFEKYVKKEKRGSMLVDKKFLKEIEAWRELLAKDIATENPDIDIYDLNEAVQLIIDRLIFLRIAEDRGIEPFETLRRTLQKGNAYKKLNVQFERSRDKYNSNLFDFEKDKITLGLKVSDKVLTRVIDNLYYPNSPYEFSVIGVEILGSVYEQFLGKVIRLTWGHNAVIEEKPEVKKAGGVYYTPQYIVDYIVENTLAEVLKDKNPKQAEKIRVLDPACGSGSFLIGAYRHLIDWHHKYYTTNDPSKHKKAIFLDAEGKWHLSTDEKKRILLNNIYGVDIDSKAVEVTKLSLALKLLEDENSETLNKQMSLFQARILPDMSHNIKCGNSLVGTQYWAKHDMAKVTEDEVRSINAFDWDDPEKGFGGIMKEGGFDVIIGNPPYVKEDTYRETFEQAKQANLAKYYQGKMDLWYMFACHSIDLLKKDGYHSFIATNNWNTSAGASILRQKLMTEASLLKFIDFVDFKVFEAASIQTMIYVLQKKLPGNRHEIRYTKVLRKDIPIGDLILMLSPAKREKNINTSYYQWFKSVVDTKYHSAGESFSMNNDVNSNLCVKINSKNSGSLLENEIGNGIDVLQDFVTEKHLKKLKNDYINKGDGVFVLRAEEIKGLKLSVKECDYLKPYYAPSDFTDNYRVPDPVKCIIYGDKYFREHIEDFPNLKNHLDIFKPILTSAFRPYGLHRARDKSLFEGVKILCIRKTLDPKFIYAEGETLDARGFLIIKTARYDLKFLTGLLDSSLVHFWLYYMGKKQGDQLQIDKEPLLKIPINYDEKAAQTKEIIVLVDKIIGLKKSVSASSDAKNQLIEQQVKSVQKKIDGLVYELYGLNKEDIAVIEAFAEKYR